MRLFMECVMGSGADEENEMTGIITNTNNYKRQGLKIKLLDAMCLFVERKWVYGQKGRTRGSVKMGRGVTVRQHYGRVLEGLY